jgi:serine/threonine protein kinase
LHRTITQVIGALSVLHQNKMVHRDMKLENILLCCSCEATSTCECLRVNHRNVSAKVADFGMAKRGTLLGLSSANVRGTMIYIPPERIQYDSSKHHKNFYALTDVYALGMFIWESLYYIHHGVSITCMEAIMPGRGEGQDVLISISSGNFVPPCDFLPVAVREFLRKCWHFEPAKRFQSMELMMEEWEKMLDPLLTLLSSGDGFRLSLDSISTSMDSSSVSQSGRTLLGKTAKTTTSLSSITISMSTSVSTD